MLAEAGGGYAVIRQLLDESSIKGLSLPYRMRVAHMYVALAVQSVKCDFDVDLIETYNRSHVPHLVVNLTSGVNTLHPMVPPARLLFSAFKVSLAPAVSASSAAASPSFLISTTFQLVSCSPSPSLTLTSLLVPSQGSSALLREPQGSSARGYQHRRPCRGAGGIKEMKVIVENEVSIVIGLAEAAMGAKEVVAAGRRTVRIQYDSNVVDARDLLGRFSDLPVTITPAAPLSSLAAGRKRIRARHPSPSPPAQATIGVHINEGTDVAQSAADAVSADSPQLIRHYDTYRPLSGLIPQDHHIQMAGDEHSETKVDLAPGSVNNLKPAAKRKIPDAQARKEVAEEDLEASDPPPIRKDERLATAVRLIKEDKEALVRSDRALFCALPNRCRQWQKGLEALGEEVDRMKPPGLSKLVNVGDKFLVLVFGSTEDRDRALRELSCCNVQLTNPEGLLVWVSLQARKFRKSAKSNWIVCASPFSSANDIVEAVVAHFSDENQVPPPFEASELVTNVAGAGTGRFLVQFSGTVKFLGKKIQIDGINRLVSKISSTKCPVCGDFDHGTGECKQRKAKGSHWPKRERNPTPETVPSDTDESAVIAAEHLYASDSSPAPRAALALDLDIGTPEAAEIKLEKASSGGKRGGKSGSKEKEEKPTKRRRG
ncbi:MAG: hypothetical protein M1840_004815 [Geoglossum simile]|nr:MAG: hypothetical protein M1840_004815 [Geoglossum simile]